MITGRGFRGDYMHTADDLIELLTGQLNNQQTSNVGTNETISLRKKRQIISDPVSFLNNSEPLFGGIDNPIVCLEIGQSLLFSITPTSYPVYDPDNLLNLNADYDLGLFNQLVEDQQLTGENSAFAFTFRESGIFSFYLSDAPTRYMYIRVVEPTSQCPEVGPFFPATPSRAVQLGFVRSSDIVQEPNWPLIGALIGGAVGIMIALVVALVSAFVIR